jgi:hypothetical protein
MKTGRTNPFLVGLTGAVIGMVASILLIYMGWLSINVVEGGLLLVILGLSGLFFYY